jgi:hypothetical protein
MAEITKAEYLEALESSGLTGHPGGVTGTRTLIGRLDIRRGERVLDLGCDLGQCLLRALRALSALCVQCLVSARYSNLYIRWLST